MGNHYNKSIHNKTYRIKHRDKLRLKDQKRYLENKQAIIKKVRKRTDNLKNEIFDAYGWYCSCCKEDIKEFLTIDHINNDGAVLRRKLAGHKKGNRGKALQTYRWLKANGFPKDNYRTLCYNCNCGRYRNGGLCPHNKKMEVL